MTKIDEKSVNAIRILAADAIQKANSGHPGLPLGAAPMAYTLFKGYLNFSFNNPYWYNRDRFILSAGHGSGLLYALLHLFNCGLSIDDIKDFRQWGSKTPGHPEYAHTPFVEATTGPLGAGMGMAVGMAMAEAHLASVFNKPDYPVVDHYTYVLGGDGCLMEGVSSEAFSLAGNLKLGKLIVIYDSNKITIEGDTDITFTEDVEKRMQAFGFQTITVEDGNDMDAIAKAIEQAKAEKTKPSFITVKTQIGYGCPAKQGKASSHGEPLGVENVAELRKTLGWECDEAFVVPQDVYDHCKKIAQEKTVKETQWNEMFAKYCEKYPEMKALWDEYHSEIDANKLMESEKFWACTDNAAATRSTSGEVINRVKDIIPNMIGGSADLGPSNKTYIKDGGEFSAQNYSGRNIHYGVREQAMSAIANGLALYGGIKNYVATFFVFSDYMKPMMRLSSLMELPVTYVFTHDSIGVGEDGPTHQPVEHLSMLRAIPNLIVYRPADAQETIAGWYVALTSKKTPVALVLTRQNIEQCKYSSKDALKGGYVIAKETKEKPDGIIIATGSEVDLAIKAKEELLKDSIDVRVVSMPSMELFEAQSKDYKDSVLLPDVRKRVVVEAGVSFGWGNYVGLDGKYVTMDKFGASAPAKVLFEKFGFTVENVVKTVKSMF